MLVCSKSTRKYFPEEKEVRIVTSAPTVDTLLEDKHNNVIAVGGGSVIDTAKIISENVICYPTTAAGSCCTSHSVYWDGTTKKSIKQNLPKYVYIVKEFVNDLPDMIKEYTTYDVLSHCLDSMWAIDSTMRSLYYIDYALEILKGQYSNEELIFAGNLAGLSIEICPTTILHSLSYPLTGFYHIPHGKALGFLLPIICKYMDFDLTEYINYSEIKLHDIDVGLVIKESLKYNKINNVNKKIDLDKIRMMIESKNETKN